MIEQYAAAFSSGMPLRLSSCLPIVSFWSLQVLDSTLRYCASQVTSVACGAAHTLFLCQDGSVHGCGDATDGQLPCSKHELTSPPGRRDDDAACSYAEVVAASAPGRSPFAPGPYRPPMYPASRQVGVATPLVAPVPRRLRLTTLNPRVRFRDGVEAQATL